MSRQAAIDRKTGETEISLTLTLDGTGAGHRQTGVGFFDHMLDLLARHGGLDLEVGAKGDLETGAHHTVEDTGLCLGRAIHEALGERRGIIRYGEALIPMDEARAACALDLSGRPYCCFDVVLPSGGIGNFDHDLAEEFFRAVAATARMTLHIEMQAGRNAHHIIEACFKSFARALRMAVTVQRGSQEVPSTKGTLTD